MKNKLKFQTSLVLYKHDQTSYKNDFMQIGGLEKLKKEWEEMAPFTCACGKYNKEDVLRSLRSFKMLCILHTFVFFTLLVHMVAGIGLR